MNSINIIGNLGKDPELRYTQNNVPVCSFSMGVKRPHVRDTTDWIDCVVWRQGAEYLCKYGHKGSRVAASGVLTVRKYEDKDGNKRKAVEVVCDAVELLQTHSTEDKGNYPTDVENFHQEGSGGFEEICEEDEDLPF